MRLHRNPAVQQMEMLKYYGSYGTQVESYYYYYIPSSGLVTLVFHDCPIAWLKNEIVIHLKNFSLNS